MAPVNLSLSAVAVRLGQILTKQARVDWETSSLQSGELFAVRVRLLSVFEGRYSYFCVEAADIHYFVLWPNTSSVSSHNCI